MIKLNVLYTGILKSTVKVNVLQIKAYFRIMSSQPIHLKLLESNLLYCFSDIVLPVQHVVQRPRYLLTQPIFDFHLAKWRSVDFAELNFLLLVQLLT